MTAIVGALNKRAVAIAADSAITLGNTHKVLNSGNKIFCLSKYAPIGIATYGNAAFMGTPWEIIIKQYRKNLRDTKYQLFDDYVKSFLDYLRDNNFFTTKQTQKIYVESQIRSFLAICIKSSRGRDCFGQNQHTALLEELNECIAANKASGEVIEDYKDYELDAFKLDFNDIFIKIIEGTNQLISPDDNDVFIEAFFYYMRIKIARTDESGLVFIGYGENDIYPSLQEVIVTLGYQSKLQYRYGECTHITNEGTYAAIIPFAQPDVTQTIIRGVNPAFYSIMTQSFERSMSGFKKQMTDEIRKIHGLEKLAEKIEALKTTGIAESFAQTSQKTFQDQYTKPLVNTIGSLGVEDLANMTESFVSLTSLVRRMSPREETVGGPIDVAVITKGDGFIWIKRKHYFDPKLNNHFFKNYYND